MSDKRNPPINIPLDFNKAVEGLLAVDPSKPVESARKPPEKSVQQKGKKKPAKKK